MIAAAGLSWIGMIAALFVAHIVRAARHAFLFHNQYALERRFDLLVALSLGYAVNTFVPFRIGELIRILYIAKRAKVRMSLVASTVVVERISDIVVAAILLPALSLWVLGWVDPVLGWTSATFLLVVAVAGALTILIRRSEFARRIVWSVAAIFNDRIALEMVNLLWTISDLFHRDLLTVRYVLATAVMWAWYLLAYALFAEMVGVPLLEVATALISTPTRSVIGGATLLDAWPFAIFTGMPILLVLLYGIIRDHSEIGRVIRGSRRLGLAPLRASSRTALFGPFREVEDYGRFLKAHFSATAPLVADFGLYGLKDAIIQRVLPGGSDALTAIVEVDDRFRIRKFAIGDAAQKLGVQKRWLSNHRDKLSLCDIISDEQGPSSYAYDMPYLSLARDFYEVIHTTPLETNRALLMDIARKVTAFHGLHRAPLTSNAVVDAYLEQKVVANVDVILDFARSHFGDAYSVNGEPYALSSWSKLRDMDWLRQQIVSRNTTVIHGDLTIENIIVCPESPGGWYIIDPNPENIFDTELIDWAKLMQSLHLGYEGLNRAGPTLVRGSDIRVLFSHSKAYSQLHRDVRQFLHTRYDPRTLREISFHEFVNYLRLTPYKIRNAPDHALTFFASAAVLFKEYENGIAA